MSKLFSYALSFFNALDEAATTETANDKDVRVFRGGLVETYRSLRISQSHYSEVRGRLINGGNISIIQQGSRGNVSIVVLHMKPDEESFDNTEKLNLTTRMDAAKLTQELQSVQRLLGGISIPDALVNIEGRLVELESIVRRLQQTPTQTNKGRI